MSREVSNLGTWSVSSFKQGQGIEQLLSSDTSTFWQSDGPQPHTIDVLFKKKLQLERVSLYFDFNLDESYTPRQIILKAGESLSDLQLVTTLDLEEPIGWIHVPFDGILKTRVLQFFIPSNHQNGKDSHIRCIQIYSPKVSMGLQDDDMLPFSTLQFSACSVIR